MASTSGPAAPIQIVRSNTALDPVGVCLALEGRLNSTDGREALAGALRHASGEGRCNSSSSGQSAIPETHAVAAPSPTCLSANAHHLPEECLSVFAATAAEDHLDDDTSDPVPIEQGLSSSQAVPCLVTQHTLPANLAAGGSSSSSTAAGGAAASTVQRPFVNAAIERTSTATLDANGGVDHGAGSHDPSCTCPPYAVKSTCGKRPNMEDTYALCPNICELPMSPMSHDYADKLPHRIAEQFETRSQEFPRAPAAPAGTEAGTEPVSQQHSSTAEQQPARAVQVPPDACSEPSAAAFAGAADLLPGQLTGMPEAESSVSSLSSADAVVSLEKLHFFGVYDGHGGIEASQHCAQRLHYHLSKAVAEMASVWLQNNAGEEAAAPWNPEVRFSPLDTARLDESSPGECFLSATPSMDETAAGESLACADTSSCSSTGLAPCSSTCSSSSSSAITGFQASHASAGPSVAAGARRSYGRTGSRGSGTAGNDSELDSSEGSSGDSSDTYAASFSAMMEDVLRDAFIKTDEEFSDSGLQAGLVGSTAVVALVGTHRVWIANCGDSRAVLSRGGKAYQVTDDHKPEREDEAERVEKAGGQVLYWNGHRVMGVLAMSRAIGDHCLRPYVIPEPEISVFARHARDELLLLASDGLWDVLSNQEATDLALRSTKRARDKGASRKAAARVAATVLTKAAVDRGSRDNITVVIIDLSPLPAGGDKPDKQVTAAAGQSDGCNILPAGPQQELKQQQPGTQSCLQLTIPCEASNTMPGHNSNSSSRQGSAKPGHVRSGSGGASNPFAAAAVSPFSTAATGSSELPLPACATHLDAAVPAQSTDRSTRSSAGGSTSSRPRSSNASASGSAFAMALASCDASNEVGSCFSQQDDIQGLATELDSLDLSGMQPTCRHNKRSSKTSLQQVMDASDSAAGSAASSQLEEQPTIVDPPPAVDSLPCQHSNSPFSTCQGSAFCDGL